MKHFQGCVATLFTLHFTLSSRLLQLRRVDLPIFLWAVRSRPVDSQHNKKQLLCHILKQPADSFSGVKTKLIKETQGSLYYKRDCFQGLGGCLQEKY